MLKHKPSKRRLKRAVVEKHGDQKDWGWGGGDRIPVWINYFLACITLKYTAVQWSVIVYTYSYINKLIIQNVMDLHNILQKLLSVMKYMQYITVLGDITNHYMLLMENSHVITHSTDHNTLHAKSRHLDMIRKLIPN